MTKTKFKKLKLGDKVISKIVPTAIYVISAEHDGYYTGTNSIKITNPEAWDLVKEKKPRS